MNSLFILILIAIAIFLFFYVFNVLFQKKIPLDTIIAFTGAPGTGKSLIGVKQAVRAYKRTKLFWNFRLIKHDYGAIPPKLVSNIPIYLGRRFIFFGSKIWSTQLTYQHLVMAERLPEYSIIFIDELGDFASQYDYDNPFVMQYIQEFFRFCRHYLDCRIFLTDQSSSNIVVAIRRRISKIYNLSNFHRYLLFFYKVDVSELIITEDIVNMSDVDSEEKPYFFGYLPFKFLKWLNLPIKPRYDSRCFSVNYSASFPQIPYAVFSEYKSRYFIDLPKSPEMRKEFQKFGYITPARMLQFHNEWQQKMLKARERGGLAGVGAMLTPTTPGELPKGDM